MCVTVAMCSILCTCAWLVNITDIRDTADARDTLTMVSDQGSQEATYHNRCLAKFEMAVAQEDYVNSLVLAEETRARTVSKSCLKRKQSCKHLKMI